MAHDPVTWASTTYIVKLAGEDAGGRVGLFESRTDTVGGPPLHGHDDADETFYILEGEAVFVAGETMRVVGPGDTVFVPQGVEHTFRITSADGGRHPVVLTPGGFQGFFGAVAAEGLTIPEDMDRINAIAAQYDLRFTGPPLPPE